MHDISKLPNLDLSKELDKIYANRTLKYWYGDKSGDIIYNKVLEGLKPPDNEIWYTSVNGEKIEGYFENIGTVREHTYKDGLGKVVFEEKVASIGDEVFSMCSPLVSITIPNSVKNIGFNSFFYCPSLTSINIPDSVESIGSGAFSNCSSITSITIPNSVESIGESAFSYCPSLTYINIPDSVKSIGRGVFEGCENLPIIDGIRYADTYLIGVVEEETEYTIKEGTRWIGNSAFEDCSLTSITIPDSVKSIGEGTFRSCLSLTSITIPDSVESIGSMAFSECTSLTSITIPDSITYLNGLFPWCYNLSSVNLGNSIEKIESETFAQCFSLRSITIPYSVTSIENSAFRECVFDVNNFHCPEGLNPEENNYWGADICDYETEEGVCIKDNIVVFARPDITTVNNIPSTVTSIGDFGFARCSSLTSITIGNSVESMGDYAFSGCESLVSLTLLNTTPPTAGSSFLYGTSALESIFVPSESVESYKAAPNWISFADKIKPIE